MDSPDKGPVKRKMFPFDNVIMTKNVVCFYCVIEFYSDV